MVDLQLIDSEIERRKLKDIFLGSLISHEKSMGIILDVCTVEVLDHMKGILRENKFRALCEDGVKLFDWHRCFEHIPERQSPVSCIERFKQTSEKTEL